MKIVTVHDRANDVVNADVLGVADRLVLQLEVEQVRAHDLGVADAPSRRAQVDTRTADLLAREPDLPRPVAAVEVELQP